MKARIKTILYFAAMTAVIFLCIYSNNYDINKKTDNKEFSSSDIQNIDEIEDTEMRSAEFEEAASDFPDRRNISRYSPEQNMLIDQGVILKANVSEEKMAELDKEKKSWQALYPSANIAWFQVECHDEKDHFYFSTEGMPLDAWIESLYNVDGWKKYGEYIVSPDESVYLLSPDGIGSYQISTGMLLDTGIYNKDVIRINLLKKQTGETARSFIRHSPIGFQNIADGFTFMDIDYDKEAAIYTDYTFDDNHKLGGLKTTYYCTDDNIGYYLNLIIESKDIETFEKYGDCIVCEYTDAYIESMKNQSEEDIMEDLNHIFEAKSNMDFY